MKHIDEQTLELLVLGNIKAKKHERQIRKHLAECVGCANLYAEIRDYYENVRLEGNDVSAPVPSTAQRSLVRKRNDLEPYFASPETEVVSYTEVKVPTMWRWVGNFGRLHPVASSFFALGFLALLASLLTFVRRDTPQPGYYYYDIKANRLEVYSTSNKLLWFLPAYDIRGNEKFETEHNAHATVITDLKGDGEKEVITSVPLRNDGNSQRLRVYDAKGDLVKTVSPKDMGVSFRGERYYAPFAPVFLISETAPDGRANLLVYSDNGRSPAFLARLDPDLNVIGRYWHYGDFAPYLVGPIHKGNRDVVITGIDDMNEISGNKFEFVAVLDPTKIVGDKESGETRGFGFEPSNAELYYIKLPTSSLETAEAVGASTRMLKESTGSQIQIQVESGGDNSIPGYWGFDFVFSTEDMAVREVKYTEPTPLTFNVLKKQGKLHGTFDKQYLENLKNGVRYWNGKEWVKKPMKIKHQEVAAK